MQTMKILTGRGNHINSSGTRRVLREYMEAYLLRSVHPSGYLDVIVGNSLDDRADGLDRVDNLQYNSQGRLQYENVSSSSVSSSSGSISVSTNSRSSSTSVNSSNSGSSSSGSSGMIF